MESSSDAALFEYQTFMKWKEQRSILPTWQIGPCHRPPDDVLPPTEVLMSPRVSEGSDHPRARGHDFRKASLVINTVLSNRLPSGGSASPKPPPIHTQVDVSDKSLHFKIILLLLVPMAGLLALSILSLIFTSSVAAAGSRLEKNVQDMIPLASILHFIQLERGTSALFLGSNGTRFFDQVSLWRGQVNGLIDPALAIAGAHLDSIQAKSLKESLLRLADFRSQVDLQSSSAENILNLYTTVTRALLDFSLYLSSLGYESLTLFQELFTAVAATHAKENLGLERGIGGAVLEERGFASESQYRLFLKQVSESEFLLRTQVPSVANGAQRALLEPYFGDPVVSRTNVQRELMIERNFSGVIQGGNTSVIWFEEMTQRIELLRLVETKLYEGVISSVAQLRSEANGQLAATVVILVVSGLATILAGVWMLWTVRARDKMKAVLSKFLPSEFLNLLGLEYGKIRLGDHASVDLAILFLDIRDFTTISEGLTGQECFDWLLNFTTLLSPIVTANGGFIDKYMGDGIMAIFRKPGDAVQAAVGMVEAVKALNGSDEVRRGEAFAFNVGVGIHYGSVVMGTMGDEIRYDVAIVSDAVNLASRLEGLSKVYGCHIVVSEDVMDQLSDRLKRYLHVQRLGRAVVRGRNAPITVYDVYDADNNIVFQFKNASKERFEEAGMLFEQGDFAGAIEICSKLCQQYEDVVSALDDAAVPGLNFFGGGRPYLFRLVESEKLLQRGKRVGQETFADRFSSK